MKLFYQTQSHGSHNLGDLVSHLNLPNASFKNKSNRRAIINSI